MLFYYLSHEVKMKNFVVVKRNVIMFNSHFFLLSVPPVFPMLVDSPGPQTENSAITIILGLNPSCQSCNAPCLH